MNPLLMVLIGPSGAGKSTFAKSHIAQNPNWVRVSRDDLRSQILGELEFGSYFQSNNAQLEKHVTNLQMEQIRYWLGQGKSILVDNCHLKTQYLQVYRDFFGHLADIIFVPIRSVSAEECKQRIRKREGNRVRVEYIDRHFEHFNEVLREAGDLLDRRLPRQNLLRDEFEQLDQEAAKDCIIVDVDLTIADHRGIRSPYDGQLLLWDKPILPVHYVLTKLTTGIFRRPTVVYMTAREEQWKTDTIQWIRENKFPWDGHLYMRRTGDTRSDALVKSELFMEHIAGRFHPLMVFDDNKQVCHTVWQKLGIFCFNVNQGPQLN